MSGHPTRLGPLTRLAAGSALCMARMRALGFDTGLVTCEGRQPLLEAGGTCRVGRLALRGRAVAVEVGAARGGRLTIGDRVFVNQGATIVASLEIAIADDVRIGDFVAIYDSDHHPLHDGGEVRRAAVRIGRNAWLGRGAIVLPGVSIGEHAVVGAGAVVTADVADRVVVAGNPARPIAQIQAGDDWRRP